jgi:hypothetical protein
MLKRKRKKSRKKICLPLFARKKKNQKNDTEKKDTAAQLPTHWYQSRSGRIYDAESKSWGKKVPSSATHIHCQNDQENVGGYRKSRCIIENTVSEAKTRFTVFSAYRNADFRHLRSGKQSVFFRCHDFLFAAIGVDKIESGRSKGYPSKRSSAFEILRSRFRNLVIVLLLVGPQRC